ncbi:hypothetical protein DV096_18450 [Bradymonadaceae bacterium TMQ3]|nr:hypothetical protein DV096_18450 [Bradymonadaceae bacterium TMQ3]TXC74490.1 hypothetical protein FRC91_15350 [Bradymonadales bacterium TMQ1]
MTLTSRIDGKERALPDLALCDAWLSDQQRFGDKLVGLDDEHVLGCRPGALEMDAVVQLAHAVGDDLSWEAYTTTPAVAQKLGERARLLPLDNHIVRYLQHLQYVCHRPRLHLRVEEERQPVSRARRIPVRAVADLMSHPGDWEHRTFRSIQPSKVLARQIEDDWDLYENRVAVHLVDHLLRYVARRLEELRKIKEVLDESQDHSREIQRTSYRRAKRIAKIWSQALDANTEKELLHTMKRLEFIQRDLQTLRDAPLYKHVSRRQAVALSLKPTNILVNDPHYRKVALLWRSWAKDGHRRQETSQQRVKRRQREAQAWDQFIVHLALRGFANLGWSPMTTDDGGWELSKLGWSPVRVIADGLGVVHIISNCNELRLLPLCSDLTGSEQEPLLNAVKSFDSIDAEVVVAHVGGAAILRDADRASGWSIRSRAVLFACSPWSIDSEERMARVLHGWLSRAATKGYPLSEAMPALPNGLEEQDWFRRKGDTLVAVRAPNDAEVSRAKSWVDRKARELDAEAQRKKTAKQSIADAPRKAVAAFRHFIYRASDQLAGIECCPVCGETGDVKPRPGKLPDSSDATWWAICRACQSEWGTRPCTSCDTPYRALIPSINLDVSALAEAAAAFGREWRDKVFGRDVWAQPCARRPQDNVRCPNCGHCTDTSCTHCDAPEDHI